MPRARRSAPCPPRRWPRRTPGSGTPGATIVWVGLGTPKQDWEVARLAGSVPVVAMAVGAAFDFLAGVKPQAPVWMQKSGTEWAFRFASEPKRLARRYLWGNPRFLVAASREPGLRKRRRR